MSMEALVTFCSHITVLKFHRGIKILPNANTMEAYCCHGLHHKNRQQQQKPLKCLHTARGMSKRHSSPICLETATLTLCFQPNNHCSLPERSCVYIATHKCTSLVYMQLELVRISLQNLYVGLENVTRDCTDKRCE